MSETRPLSERVREELALHHQGRAQGVSCRALARAVGASERDVRDAVTELRLAGVPVCAHPSAGYFLACTGEELEQTRRFLRSRAMHSLRLESALSKVPLPELVGQLRLELGDERQPQINADER